MERPLASARLAHVHHVHAVYLAAAFVQGYIEALEVEVAIYRMCMPLPMSITHGYIA